MSLSETTIRVPHSRRNLIAARVGVALRATALFCLASALLASQAQSAPCSITHLPPANTTIYPPIAKAAHVGGTVILLASFDQAGNPKVTKIISGPPMLLASATKFIELSQGDPFTGSRECPVVISFELIGPASCDVLPDPNPSFIAKDAQHLAVYGLALMLCDPAMTITKRHSFLFFHWTTTPKLTDLAILSRV